MLFLTITIVLAIDGSQNRIGSNRLLLHQVNDGRFGGRQLASFAAVAVIAVVASVVSIVRGRHLKLMLESQLLLVLQYNELSSCQA